MTFLQNQAITALPNVLRDQTVPNTLARRQRSRGHASGERPRCAPSWRAWRVLLVGALIGLAAIVSRSG